jgi:hypothetical protein
MSECCGCSGEYTTASPMPSPASVAAGCSSRNLYASAATTRGTSHTGGGTDIDRPTWAAGAGGEGERQSEKRRRIEAAAYGFQTQLCPLKKIKKNEPIIFHDRYHCCMQVHGRARATYTFQALNVVHGGGELLFGHTMVATNIGLRPLSLWRKIL